ncbi:MAG: single-stranded DNA-binding protein [Anaerolineae bacterium]|nr:single-stranded DNA-binding protein [Anaerolineae bacterium]
MSRGLNRVMIIGQLGRDPEMRYTPSGKAVTAFSVAVQQSWVSSDGESQDTVEWFHVVAWGTLAETCKKRLSQGSTVYVEGHLQTRSWEGEDLRPCYRTELVANQVIVLGP